MFFFFVDGINHIFIILQKSSGLYDWLQKARLNVFPHTFLYFFPLFLNPSNNYFHLVFLCAYEKTSVLIYISMLKLSKTGVFIFCALSKYVYMHRLKYVLLCFRWAFPSDLINSIEPSFLAEYYTNLTYFQMTRKIIIFVKPFWSL